MEPQREEPKYFEDFLKNTGWGLYYKFLISVACACHFVGGVCYVTTTYAVALSGCSEIAIPPKFSLKIFTSYLIGSGFGGFLTCALSDRYGRRRYLTYGLVFTFFSAFIAAFAYNIYVVIGAAFFMGVGLETCRVQIRLLTIEILPKNKRGFWMAFCDLFWTVGYLTTTFFVLLFETGAFLDHSLKGKSKLTTWRIMFAASGGASLIMGCVCALVEESPRFYLYLNRNYLANLLLKQLYAINNSSFADNYKVVDQELNNLISSYDLNYSEPLQNWQSFKQFLWRWRKSGKMTFSKRFRNITCVLIILKTPLIVLGILQLNLSLAKLPFWHNMEFNSLDFAIPLFNATKNVMCEKIETSDTFYRHVVWLALAATAGQLLQILFIDKLGRKFVIFVSFLLASCCLLIAGYVKRELAQLISTSVILAAVASVTSTIDIVTLELYPTAIRATTFSVINFPGYVLAAFFINFIIIEQSLFAIVSGILYSCIPIFACFLPELKNKPLVE